MAKTPSNPEQLTVEQLEAEIRRHNRLYWEESAPVISDTDYDRLVRRLQALAPTSPVLQQIGPVVPADERRYGATVVHQTPMLSLDKCYDENGLIQWASKIEGEFVATPKMDGIAASLRYDAEGRLSLAATRGSGLAGEEITNNVAAIEDVPDRIGGNECEVRGEIYMRLSIFAQFDEKFANPRNLTAGAIKQKDPGRSRAYRLSFAAYDLLGPALATETEKLDVLSKLGFRPVDHRVTQRQNLGSTFAAIAQHRDNFDYEIDGVVFKANSLAEQQRMGATAHHPRYALAYKFQGDIGTTTLEAIDWSVARTGVITPVARIAPIALSGAVVSRASLHHAGFIDKLGLKVGAIVEVSRRGGVIPKVERVVEPGHGKVSLPDTCPGCDGPTVREGDFLYCLRPEQCRNAVIAALAHYCRVMEIQGFGSKVLGEAYDQGLLRSITDLYQLRLEPLMQLERVGEKLARKLMAQIEEHREVRLGTFLRALGISELSKHVAGILEKHFVTLERVCQVTAEELAAIHTIGDVIAQAVVKGLREKANLISALATHLFIVRPAEEGSASSPLSGASFLFTGTLLSAKRKEAEAWVAEQGAKISGGVTKDLTYLVDAGEGGSKQSSKRQKAERLRAQGHPIKIISEADFLRLVGHAPSAGRTPK